MKFRLLKPNEIECRVGNVSSKGFSLLLYKNARADMAILDETVGADKWQRKHYEVKGNMYCSVGIKCGDEWVWKDDCGVESNTEKEKGEASDSFKRACVNWGIGRELYESPFIWISCQTIADGNRYKLTDEWKYQKYSVTEIGFDKDTQKFNQLIVVDKYGNTLFKLVKDKQKLGGIKDIIKFAADNGVDLNKLAQHLNKSSVDELTDNEIMWACAEKNKKGETK